MVLVALFKGERGLLSEVVLVFVAAAQRCLYFIYASEDIPKVRVSIILLESIGHVDVAQLDLVLLKEAL